MRLTKLMSALTLAFVLSGQLLAHPGHETQGSAHHNVGLFIVLATIVAITTTWVMMKSSSRSTKETSNNESQQDS